MDRLTEKRPDPGFAAPTVRFEYNQLGLRTNMVDARGTTSYLYDNKDRLIEKAAPEGRLLYGYNANGNLTNITSLNVNGVTLNYAYDELNRLREVSDGHAGRTTYTYDEVGNLRGYTYPNGLNTFYNYDSINRLTNMNVSAGIFMVANYAYRVSPSGHRTAAVETLKVSPLAAQPTTINRTYYYDRLYRLTNETIHGTILPSVATLDYSYDKVGNRLRLNSTLGAISSADYTYDRNDRLNTSAAEQFDNNGNTLTASRFNMVQPDEYDFENRLVRRTEGPKTVLMTYDGDGHRVKKVVVTATNTVTTWFLVDTVNPSGYPQVLEEITQDSSNPQLATPQVTCVYSYGHDLISQDRVNGNTWTLNFFGYDGHGNTRFLTDVNGNVTDTYDYDAFGNLIDRAGSTLNVYLFTGEQFDSDLGLYFLRARYQDTQTGRFWTMDSFEGTNCDPLTLHKYLYAHANPVTFIDPTGFFSLKETMTAIWAQFRIRLSQGLAIVRRAWVKARCSIIHLGYKIAQSYAQLPPKCYGHPFILKTNATSYEMMAKSAAWSAVVAGRALYERLKCDYDWVAFGLAKKSLADLLAGHAKQLSDARIQLGKCTADIGILRAVGR
jgi:RHS repeat-associated protein